MTAKADFNAEEWSLVLQGPPTAGMIVITSQRGGTLRETVSMARAYTEARQGNDGPELVREIVAANPEFDRTRYSSVEEFRQQGLDRLREAVSLLERKATPEEVDAYKRFVIEVAETVAKSHKEGGVLGIGGKPVSESEQAAIDEIGAAIGAAR